MDTQTVLVIKGDADARTQLSAVLRERGFDVIPAATCAEALALAVTRPPGLALLDGKESVQVESKFISDLKELNPEWECVHGYEPSTPVKSGSPPSLVPDQLEPLIQLIQSSFSDISQRDDSVSHPGVPLPPERCLRALIEHLSDGVFIKDLNGHYLAANPAFCTWLNLSEEKLLGHRDEDIQTVLSGEKQASAEQAARQGLSTELEVSLRGPEVPDVHRVRRFPIVNKEQTYVGILGIVENLSERRILEEKLVQAQKMEAIGLLAGGIAHDFNNILGAIVGHVELLRVDIKEDTRERKHLTEVLKAAQRASELVKQLTSFTRVHVHKIAPVKISQILEECFQLVRASLPASISITIDMKDQEGAVKIDATQMHQVLMNLASNAKHAMMKDGGTLHFRVSKVLLQRELIPKESRLSPGTYMEIIVRDTGCGMNKQTLSQIFEPYYTTKKEGEGTGLGLAVVRSIILTAGGYVTVSSAPNTGTEFRILLPRLEAEKNNKVECAKPVPTGSEQILYVDDEGMLADIGKEMFEKLGYGVTAETDPQIALELFKEDPSRFDLVITDQTMPGLTGVNLAREIMKIRPEIPVVICSGFTEAPVYEEAGDLGIDHFLRKPIIMKEFAEVVRKVLDERSRTYNESSPAR